MQLEKFYYDNKIVRAFGYATIVFGVVGMLAGLWAAIQIYYPAVSLNFAPTTFGRIRPVHTNAIIFAFVGNASFAGIYYSLQRLCKARMFSDKLSWIHFWGWQAIIASAAITSINGLIQPVKNMRNWNGPLTSPLLLFGWFLASICLVPLSNAVKSIYM